MKKKRFCKRGHDTFIVGRDSTHWCNECKKEWLKSDRHKLYQNDYNEEYYTDNKEKILLQKQEYYEENILDILKSKQEYYKNNKEYIKKKHKEWEQENKIEIAIRKRVYTKERKKKDLNFRLACNLRTRLNSAITGNQKKGSAVRDLGCIVEFFKNYIEKKFHNGMTWNNWGTVWELDHIKALMFFDLTDRKQFKKAVHYTNLQPLTIEEHKKKTAKEMIKKAKNESRSSR